MSIFKNCILKQEAERRSKISEIILILNQFKDTLNNFVNTLNNGSNIEVLAEPKQIYILSNNIPGLRKKGKKS